MDYVSMTWYVLKIICCCPSVRKRRLLVYLTILRVQGGLCWWLLSIVFFIVSVIIYIIIVVAGVISNGKAVIFVFFDLIRYIFVAFEFFEWRKASILWNKKLTPMLAMFQLRKARILKTLLRLLLVTRPTRRKDLCSYFSWVNFNLFIINRPRQRMKMRIQTDCSHLWMRKIMRGR